MKISVILGIFAQWDIPGLPLGLLLMPSEIREKKLTLAHYPSLDKAASLAHLLPLSRVNGEGQERSSEDKILVGGTTQS